jgi:hypothetical protein
MRQRSACSLIWTVTGRQWRGHAVDHHTQLNETQRNEDKLPHLYF